MPDFAKFQWLAEKINREIDFIPAGGKLPPIRHLAQQFNTSSLTVMKALKLLHSQGKVEKFSGNSSYQKPGDPSKRLEYKPTKMETLTQNLIQLSSRTLSSELPSRVELCDQLGCSPVTLRKAIQNLLDEGVLLKKGNKLIRAGVMPKDPVRSSLILCANPIVGQPFHNAGSNFFSGVEKGLEALGWPEPEYRFEYKISKNIFPPDHKVSGYIYFAAHGKLDQWMKVIGKNREKPLGILDISNISSNYLRELPFKKLIVLKPNQFQAGFKVGEFLWKSNRRNVLFLNPHNQVFWVNERLRGLESVFGKAGKEGLQAFHWTGPFNQSTISSAVFPFNPLYEAFVRSETLDSKLQTFYFQEFWNLQRKIMLGINLRPFFQEALKKKEINTWVLPNDDIAELAARFLKRSGVRIPDDIGLISFDNSPAARWMEFTSYDFEYFHMGSSMVSHLAGKQNRVTLETGGRLAIRSSCP